MLKTILIICFGVCSVLAADAIKVQPEIDYPIINRDSVYSWEIVRSECLPPTEKEPAERCTIKKLDDLGRVDDKNFYYVLYEWLDRNEVKELDESGQPLKYPNSNTAVVLFYSTIESPNMLHPFYADRTELNMGWFEEPRIIRSTQGVLLQIPHRAPSDSNSELDNLFSWKDSEWRTVDTQSWVDDLQNRLPEGCSVMRETLVNFENMKATNYLYKESDSSCCPTCGRFSATLAVEDDRLVIKNLQHNLKARLK